MTCLAKKEEKKIKRSEHATPSGTIYTPLYHNKQTSSCRDMKQERHEYINKGNAVYCLVETKKSDLTLNYLVYPKKRDAG